MIGKKFNKLTVLEEAPSRVWGGVSRKFWKCICECGNYTEANTSVLRNGAKKSCGCLHKENARKQGKKQKTRQSYLNLLYGEVKRAAKHRKINFELTKEEFDSIITKDCFYCGKEPTLTRSDKVGIPFPTNGIDRFDNKTGYTVKNSVPCCSSCNTAKLSLSYEEFIDMVKRIYEKHVK